MKDSLKGLSESAQHQAIQQQLVRLFTESLKVVDSRDVLCRHVSVAGGSLHIGEMSYVLGSKRRIALIAVGKAAIPMCSIIAAMIRNELRDDQSLTGIAVGPDHHHSILPPEVERFTGSHPFPDQTSRDAAHAIQKCLLPLDERDLVLFLISGGASSMVETPLDSTMSVDEVHDFYRTLVHSGLSIMQMNALRKHFSAVKGGRLAEMAAPATQCTLVISDVPGEALDMVGSGPSLPDSSTVSDCVTILRETSLRDSLSARVLRYFLEQPLHETPKQNDLAFARSNAVCLLSNQQLLDHISGVAQEMGYYVEIDNTCDDWEYREAADYLLAKVRKLRQEHTKVCLVSGGEVSVKVSGVTGVGGRNQQFAVYCAVQLANTEPYVAMLSAGSDGVDGNSPAAGGIVDTQTFSKAQALGLDMYAALEKFDSYPLLHALGNAILTGPTGNNVRDARIFISA
jgi:glycerate 2-kinase